MRVPTERQIVKLFDRARRDLEDCEGLFPVVREHARRGGASAGAGMEWVSGGDVFSDPTADTAIAGSSGGLQPEGRDKRALLRVLDAMMRLEQARAALVRCVPAVPIPHAAPVEDVCSACGKQGAWVAGRRLCKACYEAWRRWGFRLPDSEFCERRRQRLEDQTVTPLTVLPTEWDGSRHLSVAPKEMPDAA